MDEKTKLTYGMALLFIFFMVTFGSIVINEQMKIKRLPKAAKKITTYIKENYKDEDITIGKTKYFIKCDCYKSKVTNKTNKDLYFTVTYKNKHTTDDFKENYKKGKSLLNKIEKDLTKEYQELNATNGKVNETLKIKIDETLDDFNPSVKKQIIESKDYKKLNIYKAEGELIINNWTFSDINNSIIGFHNATINEKFNPTSYNFYITNPNKSSENFKIKNLKADYIKLEILNELIPAIKDNNKEILKKYNYKEDI